MPTEAHHDERFQVLPRLPRDIEVTDRVKDLYDTLVEKYNLRPPGAEKDEYRRAIRDLVDQVKRAKEETEPDFIESERNTVTQFTDRRGRAVIREIDGLGNERITTMSLEDSKKATAAIKQLSDDREQADDLLDQVKRTRAVASEAKALGSFSVADQLNAEADEKAKKATALLDDLRSRIDPAEWKSYDIAPGPEPFLPGVEDLLDRIHNGKIDGVAEAFANLGDEEPDPNKQWAAGEYARAQLIRRLPEEDRPKFERMAMELSIQAGEGHS
jgi:polyhydroxyalkanoate synthesis regulator phasin